MAGKTWAHLPENLGGKLKDTRLRVQGHVALILLARLSMPLHKYLALDSSSAYASTYSRPVTTAFSVDFEHGRL